MESSESPLLSLPPEVRNTIYQLVFTVDAKYHGTADIHRRSKTGKNRKTHSIQSLLLTCYQVYNEACGVFYSTNKISLNTHQVQRFVHTMSPKRLSSIRYLALYDPDNNYDNLKVLDYLAGLPNLATLTVMLAPDYPLYGRIISRQQLINIPKKVTRLPNLRQVSVGLTRRSAGVDHPGASLVVQAVEGERQSIQAAYDEAVTQSKTSIGSIESRKFSRVRKAMAKRGKLWAEDEEDRMAI